VTQTPSSRRLVAINVVVCRIAFAAHWRYRNRQRYMNRSGIPGDSLV
jgi:hypothetical protein